MTSTKDWMTEFDEQYKEMYCVDCLRGSWKRDHVKAFISSLLAARDKEWADLINEEMQKNVIENLYKPFLDEDGYRRIIASMLNPKEE